jgi:hypothetical protein
MQRRVFSSIGVTLATEPMTLLLTTLAMLIWPQALAAHTLRIHREAPAQWPSCRPTGLLLMATPGGPEHASFRPTAAHGSPFGVFPTNGNDHATTLGVPAIS